MLTLLDIPSDAVMHALGPFLDAESVIALSSTNHNYQTMFQGNHASSRNLWRDLCVDRWKSVTFSKACTSVHETDSNDLKNPWLRQYRMRHEDDCSTWRNILQITDKNTERGERRRRCGLLMESGLVAAELLRRKENN